MTGAVGEKKNIIPYSILAVLLLFSYYVLFFVFNYCDLKSLTAWSYELLDCVSKGDLRNLYTYVAENPRGALHKSWGGNYLCLVPIAIWNIPLWLMNGGISNMSLKPKAFLWTKLLFVICLIICAGLLQKIIGKQEKKQTSIREKVQLMVLFMAAPEIVLSVVYAAQDEIFYVLFFLLALYRLFKKHDQIGFVVFSVISVTLCQIMLLPYLVVILIREKRISRLMLYVLYTFAPSIIFESVYWNNTAYHNSKIDVSDWITGIFSGQTFSIAGMNVSLLAMCIMVVLIYCYFGVGTSQEESKVESITYWLLALTMFVYCVLAVDHFYRFFLYIPFFLILIFQTKRNKKTGLFFWSVLQIGRTIQCIFTDGDQVLNPYWKMENRMSDQLVIKLTRQGWYTHPNYNLGNALLAYAPRIEQFDSIIGAVIVVSGSMILWMLKPGSQKEYELGIPEAIGIGMSALIMPVVVVLYFALLGWWI